ncbi:MAG: pyruvate kinase, partial [Clostridia bacterium]|nr:pyruvate kinase [Clostridia bacterium]
VPGVKINLPALTEKDIKDITEGIKKGFDYIAASFVRKASDVIEIRNLLDKNGGEKIKIISKIENREGIDNFDEILEVSDGIMVARGDMGVEIPMEEVPIEQKIFIKKCMDAGKPVITATQMLESMIHNPRATRAEVSDVANAVYDMTEAVMLSGECALGKYPVECVKVMDKISKAVEKKLLYWKRFNRRTIKPDSSDLEKSIAYTTCVTAEQMKAQAIVAYTHKGDSIRKLTGLRPGCPILAITDDKKNYYQLAASFNVYPIYVNEPTISQTISTGLEVFKNTGILEKGDVVILSGGDKVLDKVTKSKMIGAYVKI